jgi:4-oxalocrotonate tautomerase
MRPVEFSPQPRFFFLEDFRMPYVNIQITAGATRAQKAALVRDVTDSLVRELGKHPEHIHVVIQEIREEDWGFAGQLTDDWRRARNAGS